MSTNTETMRRRVIPSYLENHEAVLRVYSGSEQGSDYRWLVELKCGWVFNSGRAEGCKTPMLFIDNKEDFILANPERIA